VLSKHVDFLTALARSEIDDVYMLCILEGEGLPTEYLSLGTRSLIWGWADGADDDDGVVHLYTAIDGTFTTKRNTLDAAPPRAAITFTNLNQVWFERLNRDELDYNGATITFRLVFSSVDPDANNKDYRIDDGPWMLTGGRVTDRGCTFNFGAAFDSLKLMVPALLARARRCQHLFRGKWCAYNGNLKTCNHTPGDCAKRHTILRFSAWPFSNQRFF